MKTSLRRFNSEPSAGLLELDSLISQGENMETISCFKRGPNQRHQCAGGLTSSKRSRGSTRSSLSLSLSLAKQRRSVIAREARTPCRTPTECSVRTPSPWQKDEKSNLHSLQIQFDIPLDILRWMCERYSKVQFSRGSAFECWLGDILCWPR